MGGPGFLRVPAAHQVLKLCRERTGTPGVPRHRHGTATAPSGCGSRWAMSKQLLSYAHSQRINCLFFCCDLTIFKGWPPGIGRRPCAGALCCVLRRHAVLVKAGMQCPCGLWDPIKLSSAHDAGRECCPRCPSGAVGPGEHFAFWPPRCLCTAHCSRGFVPGGSCSR